MIAVMLRSGAHASSVTPALDTDYVGEYAYPAAASDEIDTRHSASAGLMFYNSDVSDNDEPDISTPLLVSSMSSASSSSGNNAVSDAEDNFNIADDGIDGDFVTALVPAPRRKQPAAKRSKQARSAAISPSFIRFGRDSKTGVSRLDGFLRYGRSGPSFMRFGRSHSAPNFMRFGRSGIEEPASGDVLRFGRRGDNFIRFGKRAHREDGGEAELLPQRSLRSQAEQIGAGDQRQLLLAGDGTADEKGVMDAMLRQSNGMNRFERNGKEFIRFGRRDDGMQPISGKQKMGSSSIVSGTNSRPGEHFG